MENQKEPYQYLQVNPSPGLMLLVTNNCNLRCKYCYENCHKCRANEKMTWEVAKKAVDQFLDQVPEEMKLTNIGFFGGEPHVAFDIIKQVINYSYGHRTLGGYKGDIFNYIVSTNGTILDFEMYKFYSKLGKKMSFRISVDGIGEDHDANRKTADGKGSWAMLEKTLPDYKRLREKYGAHININYTINKSNYKNIYKNYRRLYEYLGMSIGHFMVSEQNWTHKDLEIIKEQIGMLQDYCTRINKWPFNLCSIKKPFTKLKLNMTGENFKDRIFEGICVAAIEGYTVDYKGDIYPCQRCYYNVGDSHKIGNVDTGGIDPDKRKKFIYEINNIANLSKNCKECDPVLRYRCNVCFGKNKLLNGNEHIIDEKECAMQKELYHMIVQKEGYMKAKTQLDTALLLHSCKNTGLE